MPEKEVTVTVEKMNIDEMIKIAKDMSVDQSYHLKRARSPKAKRMATTNLRFWITAGYYLELINEMTDDEFLNLEDRLNQKKKEVQDA